MIKNKYVYQFSEAELKEGFAAMELELRNVPVTHPIWLIYKQAKADFLAGKFSYDGATFVKERSGKTRFEVPAFIHDWRNAMGFVSYIIDNEMLSIMIYLHYPIQMITERWLYTRFTGLNIFRHKIMNTYVAPKPEFIFLLK